MDGLYPRKWVKSLLSALHIEDHRNNQHFLIHLNFIMAEANDSTSYITLVSADNHKFVLMKDVALISSVLRNMEEFEEGQTGKINLDMDGEILDVVVNYLHYHYKYKDQEDTGEIPEFKIPTHLALELLVKADYLDI